MYNSSATFVESWQIANEEDGRVLETVSRTGTATIIEQEVIGLEPGYKYNLTVQSVVQNKVSEGFKVQAVTSKLKDVLNWIEWSFYVLKYNCIVKRSWYKIVFKWV